MHLQCKYNQILFSVVGLLVFREATLVTIVTNLLLLCCLPIGMLKRANIACGAGYSLNAFIKSFIGLISLREHANLRNWTSYPLASFPVNYCF